VVDVDAVTNIDDLAKLPPEPYPGLRAFEQGEWAIFFGREPMIDEVITRLLNKHVVFVHGTSGCGKSSLVRAGVLPWLQMEHARTETAWKTTSMRPEARPLFNLGRALAEYLTPPLEDREQLADAWHHLLVLGGTRKALKSRLEGGKIKLCVLIDQFEELFRYSREGGREEAEHFVSLLRDYAASPIPGLFFLITMRSDYIGMCSQFDGFAEVVDRCQYLLPRMDNLALLRAISEPARLYGGTIDETVKSRLLAVARGEDDSLPILQHMLMRASARARKRQGESGRWTVTNDDLAAIESADGALSTHAEEVLEQAVGDNRQLLKTAEWMFRSLAEIDSQGRVVRRPSQVQELAKIAGVQQEDVIKLVDRFRARDCSFLMPPPDETAKLQPTTYVDVGHEALLRQWRRLSDTILDPETGEPKGWLAREVEDGRQWQFLTMMAQAFVKNPDASLPAAMTPTYEGWLSSHNQAWAEHYARQRKDAAQEYSDVQQLVAGSKRKARWEQLRSEMLLSLIPAGAAAVLFVLWAFVGSAPIRNVCLAGGTSTLGALSWRLTVTYFTYSRPGTLPPSFAANERIVILQTLLAMAGGVLAELSGFVDFTQTNYDFFATWMGGVLLAEAVDIVRMSMRRRIAVRAMD
jgi:hypothetical protein